MEFKVFRTRSSSMLCVAETKQINTTSNSEEIKKDLRILSLAKDNTHDTKQWDVYVWLEKLSECLKTNPPA